jgi:hypothetical protein
MFKIKRMKNNDRINKCIEIIALIYLLVDVTHYFTYRLGNIDYILVSAYYESTIISIIKWLLCISIFVGHLMNKKA